MIKLKKPYGKKRWAFAAGHIPLHSTGKEPDFTSHDKVAILNTSDSDAEISIKILFEDREPLSEFKVKVRAGRVRKVWINDLIDPYPVPLDTAYSIDLSANVNVIVQFSRMETSSRETAGFVVTPYYKMMNESSLGILSSMITPAVLILASGSLIMTTSQRLGRVIERVRKISMEFMLLEKKTDEEAVHTTKRRILYTLLRKSATRCKLLTQAMTLLYVSLGLFVATSLAIGVVGVTHIRYTWIPTGLGMAGAIVLFVSSSILIIESRLTLSVVSDEVDFVIETSRVNAPDNVKGTRRWNWKDWINF